MMEEKTCYEIAYTRDNDGQIVRRELQVSLDNSRFLISVATPSYVEKIRSYNATLSDPELQLDDNIYPLDPLGNVSDICRKLHLLPPEQLKPYLTEYIPPAPIMSEAK